MNLYVVMAGLGLNLAGTLTLAFADAWFSRSVLVYLDSLETNLTKVVKVLQSGGSVFDQTAIDLKRDRGQDRARALKLLGWLLLGVGFLVTGIGLVYKTQSLSS